MRAMILAAGLGTRMRPLTLTRPKPLIELAGKPLIEYQIENLKRAGFRQIVINHAWLGQQIEDHLGDGARFGVELIYSPEDEPLETAGGIRKALDRLSACSSDPSDPFFVVNADLYTQAEYRDMDLSMGPGVDARLWLVPNPDWHPDGDFRLSEDGGLVQVEASANGTFSGISLLRPSLFESIAKGEKAALAPILRRAISKERVVGNWLNGYWNDIGTPERLAVVEQILSASEKSANRGVLS